jgi:hypothetical protein
VPRLAQPPFEALFDYLDGLSRDGFSFGETPRVHPGIDPKAIYRLEFLSAEPVSKMFGAELHISFHVVEPGSELHLGGHVEAGLKKGDRPRSIRDLVGQPVAEPTTFTDEDSDENYRGFAYHYTFGRSFQREKDDKDFRGFISEFFEPTSAIRQRDRAAWAENWEQLNRVASSLPEGVNSATPAEPSPHPMIGIDANRQLAVNSENLKRASHRYAARATSKIRLHVFLNLAIVVAASIPGTFLLLEGGPSFSMKNLGASCLIASVLGIITLFFPPAARAIQFAIVSRFLSDFLKDFEKVSKSSDPAERRRLEMFVRNQKERLEARVEVGPLFFSRGR